VYHSAEPIIQWRLIHHLPLMYGSRTAQKSLYTEIEQAIFEQQHEADRIKEGSDNANKSTIRNTKTHLE
jgi:hypothetical protein